MEKTSVVELREKIATLQAELEESYRQREDLTNKLDDCIKFAEVVRKQRDEAMNMVEQMMDTIKRSQNRIVLPEQLDADGKSKILL